jgi:hypothetical protein
MTYAELLSVERAGCAVTTDGGPGNEEGLAIALVRADAGRGPLPSVCSGADDET